jgi:acetolactate synthase-1/2/3 large subunit
MHGEAYADQAVQSCDVLIRRFGMRFDDRITGWLDEFAEQAEVIHFELDRAEVGKNIVPECAGDRRRPGGRCRRLCCR